MNNKWFKKVVNIAQQNKTRWNHCVFLLNTGFSKYAFFIVSATHPKGPVIIYGDGGSVKTWEVEDILEWLDWGGGVLIFLIKEKGGHPF